MKIIKKYFWNLKDKELKENIKIIKTSNHPKHVSRMTTLLSRCDKPKELFSIIRKQQFIESWPKISRYWKKTGQSQDFMSWWEAIYNQLSAPDGTVKGNPIKELKNIGQAIKKARIEMNLSQSDIAQRTGIKQPDISKIEKGRGNITLATLIRLCRILDIKSLTF